MPCVLCDDVREKLGTLVGEKIITRLKAKNLPSMVGSTMISVIEIKKKGGS